MPKDPPDKPEPGSADTVAVIVELFEGDGFATVTLDGFDVFRGSASGGVPVSERNFALGCYVSSHFVNVSLFAVVVKPFFEVFESPVVA